MADRLFNVLFLCTGNSARSILAEAILGREGIGRFNAYSAGSQPKGEVHPCTRDVLSSLNYDAGKFRSKSWELDFVFTVCDNAANEVCPIWPGQPMTAHWGIPDPAAIEGSAAEQHAAFFDAYRMLANRIGLFVNLPFASLDRLSLQSKLTQIGQS
jgi:arsenate reductase